MTEMRNAMQLFSGRQIIRLLLVPVFLVVLGGILTTLVRAQDTDGVVTVTGKLNAINSDGTIVIDGITYKLGSGVDIASTFQVGNTVTITANVSNGGTTLVVITVSVVDPTSTPTSMGSSATATATGTPNGTPT